MDELLSKTGRGTSLSIGEAKLAFDIIFERRVPDGAIADFLLSLARKGESAEEIAGCALAMRERMLRVSLKSPLPVVDNCGTGGDAFKTANISTPSAIVAAACGVGVAKHGNRAVTGTCGSADLLENLGVALPKTPDAATRCFYRCGISFFFAPLFHPALAPLMPIRRSLGVPTVFNLVGPLCNPAGAKRQVIGVCTPALASGVAEALSLLGTEQSLVVCGTASDSEYVDEISPQKATSAFLVRGTAIEEFSLTPEDFGAACVPLELLHPALDKSQSASEVRSVFYGVASPRADALCCAYAINSSAALFVAGMVSDFAEGASIAREAISSGAAGLALSAFSKASALS
jgi:anthranilate phosphoribosyltransferase